MTDIQELFARDPLSLTHDDTQAIITHYRTQRQHFKDAEKAGPKPKAAKPAKKAPVDVDLDELFKDGV